MARIAQKLAEGRTTSFEFFPPKTVAGRRSFERTVGELEALEPNFASVTYGAGGSDRHRTGEVVRWMRQETGIDPMAHMTCIGHSRDDVAGLLVEYRRLGVENILALGGDPPADGSAPCGDYAYALDLLRDVAAPGCFSIGVAAHPQVHPRSPNRASDRRHLATKLRLADFAITQFFFEVEHWTRLVDELAEHGVDKPVIPGIMPIVSAKQVRRMAEMSGAELPGWLCDALDAAADDDEVRRIGVDVASELAAGLLDAGAPGLHLYTLNRADVTKQVCANLRPAAA